MKEKTLQDVLEELDEVTEALGKEQVSLEDSFDLYHKGMKLLKDCNDKIDRVEKKMKILEENGVIHDEVD